MEKKIVQLHINPNAAATLRRIQKQLITKSDDFCVSFCFDVKKNQCKMVGGHAPEYAFAAQDLNDDIQTLNTLRSFSLSGDVFENWLRSASNLQGLTGENFITLNIEYHSKESNPSIIIYDTKEVSLADEQSDTDAILARACRRQIKTHHPFEAHRQFIDSDTQRGYQKITKSTCQNLIHEIKPHLPFQMIEFDPGTKELKIMRDDRIDISETNLNIELGQSFISSEHGVDLLGHAIKNTADNDILIQQENDRLIIKTSEQCSVLSLAAIDEFKQKVADRLDVLSTFTVDIRPFKFEVEELRKFKDVRSQDIAFFVIKQEDSYLVAQVKGETHTKPILVPNLSMKSQEQLIVQFHLKEFIDLKVRNLTEMREMKVSVYKNSRLETYLGFFDHAKKHIPTQSLSVELISNVKKIRAINKIIEDHKKDKGLVKKEKTGENHTLDLEAMF
ncbi:hypothetical protein [Vibrio methylphosphonaticus]|uniref:hypothetical protein n=1 Tax=Vibrio methylphosphonaticus TaxID=2946866 RepID=UPI00202A327B|nr:hypothetical protein [Vibrio methylphosphonaticus]MCL9775495.1 hypothetical protein [Vibrio methylphosphonaticus]